MKTVRVVAAILIEKGRVFATQRGYGEYKGGWEFPGGKIEKDETGEEALQREIMEELRIPIEITSYFDTIEYAVYHTEREAANYNAFCKAMK